MSIEITTTAIARERGFKNYRIQLIKAESSAPFFLRADKIKFLEGTVIFVRDAETVAIFNMGILAYVAEEL